MFDGQWGHPDAANKRLLPDWNGVVGDPWSLNYRVERSRSAVCIDTPNYLLFGELLADNCDDLRGTKEPTFAKMLLESIACVGNAAFDRVEGQFALALWNKQDQELTLVRDALGRRPLYFAMNAGSLYFGSHARNVAVQSGRVSLDIDEMASFLMQRLPAGRRSFFSGVSRVEPGSLVRFPRPDDPQVEQWWWPDFSPTNLDDNALIDELDHRFDRSVATILGRHDRVAAHLSAGLDSSLTVVTAARRFGPERRLAAICASPANYVSSTIDQSMEDEFPIAAETAEMLGNVDLERVRATDESWLTVNDRFSAAAGMPYRNPLNLGWLAASYAAAARGGATVLLDSTQGNTTLSWIGKGAIQTLIRRWQFGALRKVIADVRRYRGGSGLMVVPWALWQMLPRWVADPVAAVRRTPTAARQAFLHADHPAVRAALGAMRKAGQSSRWEPSPCGAQDRLNIMRWAEYGSHAAAIENLYGIELADPYASKRLVELTLRIAEPRFLDQGFGRRFARRLLAGKVPPAVSAGTVDWQQGVDWRCRALDTEEDIRSELDFADEDAELSGLLDVSRLRAEVDRWSSENDSIAAMSRSGGVLRAIAAIRFVRKATELNASESTR